MCMYRYMYHSYSHATKEPGTAEPFIGKPLDTRSITGFLVLMTDGLYDAYQSWTGRPTMVNQDLAHLIAQEMDHCQDVAHVAQNVVEKVKQVYKVSCWEKRSPGRIDDITLIIRNFGYPLGGNPRPSETVTSAFHPHPKLHPTVSVPPLPLLNVSAVPNNVPMYPTAPIIPTTGPNTSVSSGSPFFPRAHYTRQDGFPPAAGPPGPGYSTLQPTQLRKVASDEQMRRNLQHRQEEFTAGMRHHDQQYNHGNQQYDRPDQYDPQFFSGINQPPWSQPPPPQVQQPQPPYYQQSSQGGGGVGAPSGAVPVPMTSSPIQTHLQQPTTPPSRRRPASAHGSPYENWQTNDDSAVSPAPGVSPQARVQYENVDVRLSPSKPSGGATKRYSDGQLPELMEKIDLAASSVDKEASTPLQAQPPSTLPVNTPPSGQTRPVPAPRRLKKVPVDKNSPDKRTSGTSDEWMYIDDSEATPTDPSMNKPISGQQLEMTDDLTTPIPEEQDRVPLEPEAKDSKGKEEIEEGSTESEGDDDGVLEFTSDLLYDSVVHPEPVGPPDDDEQPDDGCMKSYVGFNLPEDLSWEAL